MLRERIDEYLDGSLDPTAARELEAVMARDLAAAKLLSRIKAERALRTAAYESYLPTRQESEALAMRVLDEAYHMPLGRVGYWIRHGSAVAAAVLVVAGSFLAGRITVPVPTEYRTVYQKSEPREVFIGMYEDARGNRAMSPNFGSPEELKAFFNGHGNLPPMNVGDRMRPGKI